VSRLQRFVTHFEEVLAGTFLVVMVVTVIANVILRLFTSYSLYWAEELATICFVWAVFIGASASFKHKGDLAIDVLVKQLSLNWQRRVRLLVWTILLVLNAYIFVISIVFTVIAYGKPTAVFGVSSAVFNSALVVSFGLISVHAARFLWQQFTCPPDERD